MTPKLKDTQTSKKALTIESGVKFEQKTNWDEIAKKAGVVASIFTGLAFFVSILFLIIQIYSHLIDFSNKQTDLIIKLTDRVSQLEGKLDILSKTIDP